MNRQIRTPRDRPDGAVTSCCSSSSTWCRWCGPTGTTPTPATTGPSCATSPAPAAPSSRPTVRSWPRASPRATATATSAATRPASCSPTSAATSRSRFGSTQLERTQNDTLSGTTSRLELQGLGNLFSDQVNTGDVVTTMRADLQQVAKDALGDRDGASSCSTPTPAPSWRCGASRRYDPNLVASHDFEAANGGQDVLRRLPGQAAAGQRYQERYMPGSTFKVDHRDCGAGERQVHARLVRSPRSSPTSRRRRPSPIHNYGGSTCGGTFVEVFRAQLQHRVRRRWP